MSNLSAHSRQFIKEHAIAIAYALEKWSGFHISLTQKDLWTKIIDLTDAGLKVEDGYSNELFRIIRDADENALVKLNARIGASEMGKVSGKSCSPMKVAAARKNGKLGGRPLSPEKNELYQSLVTQYTETPSEEVQKNLRNVLQTIRFKRIGGKVNTPLWNLHLKEKALRQVLEERGEVPKEKGPL